MNNSRQFNSPILALDVGEIRVGVAIARPTSTLAFPLIVLPRAAKQAEREIIKIIGDEKVNQLIVGLPLSDDGSENEQCQKVKAFCERLQKRVQIEIEYIDEYASSAEAEELLSLSGNKGKTISAKSDAAAACLILQYYLDHKLNQ